MKSRTEIQLQFLLHFRGRSPSVFEVITRQPRSYWLALLVLLAAVAFYQWLGGDFAPVFLGMAAGALLRDLGRFLRFVRDWPVVERIISWPAVEQELARFRGVGA